jgi:L-asparaginase
MATSAGEGGVCVLYTGGTVGTRSMEPELDPGRQVMLNPDELERLLTDRSGLDIPMTFVPVRWEQGGDAFTPLVSSRVGPGHWVRIAETILENYERYAGFVVLHGTDTMAWTASALSFMFGNLGKPVVLTGAQRPIMAAPSDAVANFVSSVMLATHCDDSVPLVPEVVICFGELVLRGNRSTKISAASLQGFESPNAPRLGRVGRRFEIDADQLRPAPLSQRPYLRSRLETRVADVLLYPGISAAVLEYILEENEGAVLRTFGAGNAPGGVELERVLTKASGAGKILVNITQTDEGMVEAGMLSGSRTLTDCGVLSGLDLTAEAALTKLMVLLGSEPRELVAQQLQLDQRGEQSMDLVELAARAQTQDTDGALRLIMSPALHARVRQERLVSAVLRLRLLGEHGVHRGSEMVAHLNNWPAQEATPRDSRSAVGRVAGRPAASASGWDVTIDVTDQCRELLVPGAPVTLTATFPGHVGSLALEANLSLFMARVVDDR